LKKRGKYPVISKKNSKKEKKLKKKWKKWHKEHIFQKNSIFSSIKQHFPPKKQA